MLTYAAFLSSNSIRPYFCIDENRLLQADSICGEGFSDIQSTYVLCFYFCMTTLTTVGYGDVGGENSAERIYCACLQVTCLLA